MIIRDIELEDITEPHSLVEMEQNNSASDYICNNFNKLVKLAHKFGIMEKAEDLVVDVYITTLTNEQKGKCYDMNYNGGYMSVEDFVVRRLKGYSKNAKYRNDIAGYKPVKIKRHVEREVAALDSRGRVKIDKNGRVVTKVVIEAETEMLEYREYSASYESSELEDMSEFQRALSLATDGSKLEEVEDKLSITEDIQHCIDICDLHGVKILNIFKNIDKVASLLSCGLKSYAIPDSFKKLSELAEYNNELGESLRNVLNYSMENKEAFQLLIEQY